MVFIRRGYGAFVQCKNIAKARHRARHWHRTGQGGSEHPVIGLFLKKPRQWMYEARRIQLYP